MSNFLETISHAKRLNSALKDVSTEELTNLIAKLNKIIDARNAKAEAELAAQAEMLAKIEDLKRQMADSGITANDLLGEANKTPRKKRDPRPAKYAITVDGKRTTWTGQGRMPNAFKNASQPIDSFLINKDS